MKRLFCVLLFVLCVMSTGNVLAQGLSQTATPTPTPTPTSTPTGYDAYEPNDTPDDAVLIGVGDSLSASLHTSDAGDWWKIFLKSSRTYRIEVLADPGGDPQITLYSESMAYLDMNRDCGIGTSACLQVSPTAPGFFYLEILSEVPGLFAQYTLRVVELMPTATPSLTPTPTSTPTSTPGPTATPAPTSAPNDAYEPNYSFETATEVVLGQSLTANLVRGDNDFFMLYAKGGVPVRCDVTPRGSVDTNLIVYDQWRATVGGNDDRQPGEIGSSFSWIPVYSGWYYLLVGPVAGEGEYSLACAAIPPTPTPTSTPTSVASPGGGGVAPTSTPPLVINIPTATPGSGGNSPSDVVGTVTPTPTPLPPIQVVIYYDQNGDRASSPAEGIPGAVVLLLDASTNKPLEVVLTDDTGLATFRPVTEGGFMRVSIPYLAFNKSVNPGAVVEVRIESIRLPGLIP